MKLCYWPARFAVVLLILRISASISLALTFRVVTYNIESYLDLPTPTRTVKTAEGKAKVRESIVATQADVIALQELGSLSALTELQASLKADGLDLPYTQLLWGSDTNIHIGVLSRFPFAATRAYTNESFLLHGRRFHVSRGFLEAQINVNSNYCFTLLAGHLKSKRAMSLADEAEIRLEEAKLLREKIDGFLAERPEGNLVVLGDFNDTKDAASTRAVLGQGKSKLIDTRPPEKSAAGGAAENNNRQTRTVTWTHFYGTEDSYSRIDYILLTRGMAREWVTNQSYVLALPGWGTASDHRPVVTAFEAEDR